LWDKVLTNKKLCWAECKREGIEFHVGPETDLESNGRACYLSNKI